MPRKLTSMLAPLAVMLLAVAGVGLVTNVNNPDDAGAECATARPQLSKALAKPVAPTRSAQRTSFRPALDQAGAPSFASAGGDGALPRPEDLLLKAIHALEAHDTVSCKIRYEIDLFGRQLMGTGMYAEQRPATDCLMRLELRLQLGDRLASVVQVSDGRYLWDYSSVSEEPTLSRFDFVRITRTLADEGKLVVTPGSPALPGLGGLPRLIRGLHAQFDFTLAEPGYWGAERRLVWKLTGQWKQSRLPELLPAQREALKRGELPDLSRLPSHLPDQVVVLLGQEDLFPYRVEYLRAAEGSSHGPLRTLVAVDCYEAAFDLPLDPGQFVYNPGNSRFTDLTDAFIRNARAAQ